MSKVEKLKNGGTREVNDEGFILYKNSKGDLHREDGPAFIIPKVCAEYHLNGKFTREDGPCVVWANGAYEFIVDNNRHRDEGPSVWTPFDGVETNIGYIVKFNKNQELINTPEFCGEYFLQPGDVVYEILKTDPDDHSLYRVLEELNLSTKKGGEPSKHYYRILARDKKRESHLVFMTKYVPLEYHETFRLPKEVYDNTPWE